MSVCSAVVLAVSCTIDTAAGAGTAQRQAPATVALQWVRLPGAESCIASPALATALETTIGRRVFTVAGRAQLVLEGHVQRTANGWRATLSVSRADGHVVGQRVLEDSSPRCSALSEAVVAVAALLIDPEAEPAGAAADSAAPAPAMPAPMRVRAGPRVGLGGTPVAEWGLLVGWEWAFADPTSIDWALWAAAPREATLDGHEVALQSYGSALGVCHYLASFQGPAAGMCIGAEVSALRAALHDAGTPDVALRAGATLAGRFSYPLVGPLSVEAQAGGALLFVRPELTVQRLAPASLSVGDHTLWRAGPLAAWLSVAASLRF